MILNYKYPAICAIGVGTTDDALGKCCLVAVSEAYLHIFATVQNFNCLYHNILFISANVKADLKFLASKRLPLLSWACFILGPGRVQVQHILHIWRTQAAFLLWYVTIYIADRMMDQMLNQSYSKIFPPNDLITWGFTKESFYLAIITKRFFFF